MKILVIDDLQRNQDSARETLKDHDLTVAGSINEAHKILWNQKFDAVLTDIYMPAEKHRLTPKNYVEGQMVPAGLVFALRAANLGSRVVICSDADHHQDYLTALFDLLYSPEKGKEERIAVVDARGIALGDYDFKEDSVLTKDWRAAMVSSKLFPEIEIKRRPEPNSTPPGRDPFEIMEENLAREEQQSGKHKA